MKICILQKSRCGPCAGRARGRDGCATSRRSAPACRPTPGKSSRRWRPLETGATSVGDRRTDCPGGATSQWFCRCRGSSLQPAARDSASYSKPQGVAESEMMDVPTRGGRADTSGPPHSPVEPHRGMVATVWVTAQIFRNPRCGQYSSGVFVEAGRPGAFFHFWGKLLSFGKAHRSTASADERAMHTFLSSTCRCFSAFLFERVGMDAVTTLSTAAIIVGVTFLCIAEKSK